MTTAARVSRVHYGYVAVPTMIGFTRPPPRVTILRRDPARVALIESMDRNHVIDVIAAHLFESHTNRRAAKGLGSMPRMYGRRPLKALLYRWQATQ